MHDQTLLILDFSSENQVTTTKSPWVVDRKHSTTKVSVV